VTKLLKKLFRVTVSLLTFENEHMRQTNESMGRLATSTLNANQGLQKQLKILSHPGIDIFMGRRRRSEGPYYDPGCLLLNLRSECTLQASVCQEARLGAIVVAEERLLKAVLRQGIRILRAHTLGSMSP